MGNNISTGFADLSELNAVIEMFNSKIPMILIYFKNLIKKSLPYYSPANLF